MSYQQEIFELVEIARKYGSAELDLSNKQLTSLPPQIEKLPYLTRLNLSKNRFASVPLEILKLTNLVTLDLGSNELTSLPPEITKLTNLTDLGLWGNQLTSLPPEITKLTNLTDLRLWNNQLTSLPPEIAELRNLTGLDLSFNQLMNLPPEMAKLTSLTSLDLSFNRLTSVPLEVTKLTSLTFLTLSSNQLTSLAPEISKLPNLIMLELGMNQLESLPPEIADLTNLISLNVSDNQLTSLPPEIAELNLTQLDVSANQLTSLPPEITKLTNLTHLNVSANQLTSLPAEITELTNLTNLNVSANQLMSLPTEITELTNLTNLKVSFNKLTSVPAEITKLTNLTALDLSGNQLISVPAEITKLANLTHLGLSNNQLPVPPETLADPRNVKAIFAAIAALVSGERLNEAKLLLVGDGKVGKTSIVERLIYNTYTPQKQTTLGVAINDEMKVIQSEVKGSGEPIKLNIWDFGGQEIQHSTHQFFMTTRSLYLLVVDARKGDQIGNLEYWLKLIESFGGDSPIIVVINQIDQLKGQRPLNIDRKALQEKYNVRDFVETSCETGEGIPTLGASITRQVEQLKHVRDIWPREWLAIKKRLREMKKDYIPVETYEEICAEEGLSDPDLRESLLESLHDLGVVIRFPGDTQVLNPRWVTQGVYGLLTSAQLVKSLGQFDLKEVGKILDAIPDTRGRYPAHTHRRLIAVMEHFQLCFEFTDRPGHYLIPRHLHDTELDIPWDDANALKFQYHYAETLPDSVISRFIVRMNQYITKQYYWKNGVFLHSGENRAKIKVDLVDRKIFISINGNEHTRRTFLAIIRSAFDEINSNFKIEIQQKIPVPNFPQVLVSYQDLIVHEEMNVPEILIPELRKKFSVRELLDGVEELSLRLERRNRESGERKFLRREPEEVQPKIPTSQPKNKPLGSLMAFIFGFIVLLAAIVAAAVAISKWVSVTAGVMTGVVIIGAVLAIGVLGALQLRNDDRLSEDNFLELMVESYKRLPLLGGNGDK